MLLVPIEDAVEDPHLRAVERELAMLGFVDPLLNFDAVPVQPQPRGMAMDLLPSLLVLGGGGMVPSHFRRGYGR